MKLKETCMQLASQLISTTAQQQDHHNPEKIVTPGMPKLLRSVAAQGMVLLENRVLPLAENSRVALFGRTQCDYFYTGYGSGGDVNFPYSISPLDGLRNCRHLHINETLASIYSNWVRNNPVSKSGWGAWARCHPEMPITDAQVRQAKRESNHAVIILGRASGEDRENVPEPGSYYLTEEEKHLLENVTSHFPDAVLVLNTGSIPDLSFLHDYSFGAVLLAWQGGMESGNALADVLCGKTYPAGRLTATIAKNYKDYPSANYFGKKKETAYYEDIYVGYRWFETFAAEDVLYPFGYGLSYTTFSLECRQIDPLAFQAVVTNTGNRSGKETVMLFVQKPCGVLGNPARELVAFGKTRELAPGEQETLILTTTRYQLASYDDGGVTGYKSCYVLQEGDYIFHLGENVRSAQAVGTYTVEKLTILKQHQECCAPVTPFHIAAAEYRDGAYSLTQSLAPAETRDLRQIILDHLPAYIPQTGDMGYKLQDVKEGTISLDTFVAQLDLEELEAITRGGYIMGNPLGAKGNAGIFAGVTESLREKGVPVITTTDGPSGIRLYDSCSLAPIGTLLASTFDTALVETLYTHLGMEMKDRGSDVLLAPGMNIQRNPLCGRNFEYYSEDPFLTGRMAAAAVRGIQSQGLSACPKHFACNNQETNRTHNNSIVSERALREIYLRGFEICVKQSAPKNIMTSYNKINGVWSHYNYELVQRILRGEWGYQGNVITDWWMRYAPSPEFPNLTGNAYRIRAGVDVLMPGSRTIMDHRRKPDGTLLATYGQEDGITLGEIQACAKHVLRCAMELKEL